VFPPTQVQTPPPALRSSALFFSAAVAASNYLQASLESLDIALVIAPSIIFFWHLPNIHLDRLKQAALVAQAAARALAVAGTPLRISEAVGRNEPRLFRALFPGWIVKSHAVFPDIHDKNRSEFVRRLVAPACACLRLRCGSDLCRRSQPVA
jgi:hypothetical protein